MDITELIRGIEITQTGWPGEEAEVREDFIWGIDPETLYQMTRAEYKTEPNKIAVKDLIRLFKKYFLRKRNTYHNRGKIFLTRQTESATPEDFWRRLIEIEKEYAFEGITAEDLLISKFMTAITDTKLRTNWWKRKNFNWRQQSKRWNKIHTKEKTEKFHTGSSDFKPRKRNKRRANTKNGKIWYKTDEYIYIQMRNHVDFVTQRTGTPLTNSRHWENFAVTAGRRDISHAYADKEKATNAKYALWPGKRGN